MTFVATDANLACDHTHDPPDLVGITTATDGTCAVHLYLHHYDVFVQTYGASPIDQWDTSQVTDMSHLFENELDFNEDISGWNVDAGTSMHDMFLHAESFDQDLGWCIEEACPAIDDENETYEEYKARIAPLQAGCNGANGQPCCVDMTDAFFYSPCILRTGANGGTCGVKNTEGACQPTPMPTTAADHLGGADAVADAVVRAHVQALGRADGRPDGRADGRADDGLDDLLRDQEHDLRLHRRGGLPLARPLLALHPRVRLRHRQPRRLRHALLLVALDAQAPDHGQVPRVRRRAQVRDVRLRRRLVGQRRVAPDARRSPQPQVRLRRAQHRFCGG